MHAEDFVLCRQMIALNAAMELTHRQMAAFFAAEIDDSEDAALEEAELWDDEEEKSDSESRKTPGRAAGRVIVILSTSL